MAFTPFHRSLPAADLDQRGDRMTTCLAIHGVDRWSGRLERPALDELARMFDRLAAGRPGARIDPAACDDLAAFRAVAPFVRDQVGPRARPVRALLFDKSDDANWALGWHQDRTIKVAEWIDVPGYGPWTVKHGRIHAVPPIDLLERMLTVRIHLDAVPEDNGPLHVAPGSHRLGFIAEDAIADAIERCGTAVCLADAGTIWFYATPIIHSSARSSARQRRRVLQMDIAAEDLPGGLRWAADIHRTTLESAPSLA